MPVLSHIWGLLKRQSTYLPAQCYAAANSVGVIWQSIGKSPSICIEDGEFSSAYANFTSCTSEYANGTTSAVSATIDVVEDALSFCSSVISSYGQVALSSSLLAASSAAVASSCASLASAGIVPNPSIIRCSATSTPTSTFPTYSSTSPFSSTPSSSDTRLTTGAVAGIAVGSAMGGILMLALVIFFIWRHRRNHERQQQTALAAEQEQETKAQLHSDDYKAPREELEDSKGPHKIRTIEGLHEVEYHDLAKYRSEMSVNEVAAAELREGTQSSTVAASSTLVGSSAGADEQRT